MKKISSLKLKLDWKQAALYELALFSLGLFIGSTWPEFFTKFSKTILLIIFTLAGGYIVLLWLTQNEIFNTSNKK